MSSASARGVPAGASKEDRSRISASAAAGNSSPSPISSEAQIMPKDSTPRSLEFLMTTGSPSPCQRTEAPGQETATRIPAHRLLPPHTISFTSPPPISVLQTFSLSALGWGLTSRITPTIILSKRRERSSIFSTSTVDIVRSYASFFRSIVSGIET